MGGCLAKCSLGIDRSRSGMVTLSIVWAMIVISGMIKVSAQTTQHEL